MVQIKNFPKYVIIIWLICNLLALPAAAVYREDYIIFSKDIKKENNKIGAFGKVNPINHFNKKIILLNINNDNTTRKPLLLIYPIYFLTIILLLSTLRPNKKAVLFTITTIMLSASLVLLTSSYLDRSKDLQYTLTSSLTGNNLGYSEDDIITNAYYDLLWINLSVERSDPDVTINFSRAGMLSPSINHQQLMANYKNFIENTYSNLNNIDVNLTDFYPNFTIAPFNATYEINGTNMSFYTNDIAALQEIVITIIVNQLRADETSNSTPSDTGSKIITVKAYDINGLNLFQGNPTTINLDPTAANSPYEVIFSGADLRVFFGTYNSNNGVLRVETNNLNANITQLELTYTSNETITILPDAQLDITKLNLNKQTDVVLYEG